MEHRTKLVGGYLRLCCVFTVFMCVSSVNVYNPKEYIKEISRLLNILHDQLQREENFSECTGTYLDMFRHGTEIIGKNKSALYNTTRSIDDCVYKLKNECTFLQVHNKTCENGAHMLTDIYFVTLFEKFSNCRGIGSLSQCCYHAPGQKYNGNDEEFDPPCGHP